MEKEKHERGEIGEGMRKKKGRKPKHLEEMEESCSDSEEMEGGRMGTAGHDDMTYMRNSLHTGMDMPTEAQFKRGGKMKKGKKKVSIDDISGGAMEQEINVPEAIKVLSVLASKFNLKLVKP